MRKFGISLKKIAIISILLLLVISSAFSVRAFVKEADFNNFEKGNTDKIDGVSDAVDNIGGVVINVIRVVAVTVAMVMLLVIAMKYMIAAPGERADIKKHAVVYVVGAFILFGLTGILSVLTEFAKKITPEG